MMHGSHVMRGTAEIKEPKSIFDGLSGSYSLLD